MGRFATGFPPKAGMRRVLASGTALDGRMLLLIERAIVTSPVPLITRSEARVLGITLRASTHVRLRRGIYAPKQAFLRLKPWQRYAARVHAFARSRPDAVLCLESAAVLHGMPVFGHPCDIHVFDPDLRTSQRSGDVCVHTSADPREIATVAGASSRRRRQCDLARAGWIAVGQRHHGSQQEPERFARPGHARLGM